jgi:hypothetical protein
MPWELLVPIFAGVASWYGSHIALRTHLDYLRRDVDHAHRRIDKLEY